MKVLVINGSPKGENSNTIKITNAFLEGTGWSDLEVISVANSNIKSCLGCYACWNKTPGKCVIKDSMADILPKIVSANIIIWSFPLYYFGIPGKLKNLIDRQLPLNLPFMSSKNESGGHPSRFDLTQQRHIVISTCGFWTAKGNYESVNAMFDHFFGSEKYFKLYCGQGELFRVPELKTQTEAYLDIVRRAGKEYVNGKILDNTLFELSESLYPRDVFEKMADASWGLNLNTNQPTDESLNFTTQMAALYRPDGLERVLEFYYTDINKTYQILLTKNGSEVITENFKTYTTKIETPFKIWSAIARGEISGPDALFKQQYKVVGDFDLMMKWDELFGNKSNKKTKEATKKIFPKTNMIILLLPWLVIWTTASINAKVGGIASIVVVSFIPLLWLFFKSVIFEQVSLQLVALLSLLLILGVDAKIIVPLSYGIFGVMWIIGTFTKIPLTAYYSARNYGYKAAFDNPLFVRTNRILTAIWGILYIITPIWTYFIMGTSLSSFVGLINSICPVIMGLFTSWFQKWYPAYFSSR